MKNVIDHYLRALKVCSLTACLLAGSVSAFGQAPSGSSDKRPSTEPIKPPTASKSDGSDDNVPTDNNQMRVRSANTNAMVRSDVERSVLLPNRSPLVTFRILFLTGSASDPVGKEGMAALTAAMLTQGGSKKLSYEQITDAMYPLATGFGSQVDKEMTVFSGTTHKDNLDAYYGLISQMLLDPGFREDDFQRLRSDALSYIKTSLREGNDEEFGKEALYNTIYAGTAYGHLNSGNVSAVEKLTLDDVRAFYRDHYTQSNLVLGISGGYPTGFDAKVKTDFRKLSAGKPDLLTLPELKLAPGTKIEIIQRETRSTAISLGFPISITRSNPDWPALAVAASYFGQHRSSNSYLYNRLREIRGLNYGDYAYIEYFPSGMFQFQPDPNLGRQSQIFQIWIRPVEPQNGHFALRAALFEYDRLVRDGMSQESFEGTRDFLSKFVNVLTSTQNAQLGYALDSKFYDTPEFTEYMRTALSKLTLDEVNRVIRKYLKSDRMRIELITRDADGLRNAIVNNTPSPITYNSTKPDAIMAEDKLIQDYRINVKPEDVTVVSAGKIFQ